jgi:hypothetical protein
VALYGVGGDQNFKRYVRYLRCFGIPVALVCYGPVIGPVSGEPSPLCPTCGCQRKDRPRQPPRRALEVQRRHAGVPDMSACRTCRRSPTRPSRRAARHSRRAASLRQPGARKKRGDPWASAGGFGSVATSRKHSHVPGRSRGCSKVCGISSAKTALDLEKGKLALSPMRQCCATAGSTMPAAISVESPHGGYVYASRRLSSGETLRMYRSNPPAAAAVKSKRPRPRRTSRTWLTSTSG